MKLVQLIAAKLLCITVMSATAQSYPNTPSGSSSGNTDEQQTNQNTQNLSIYVENWAAYLGYDVTVKKKPKLPSLTLVDVTNTTLLETLMYATYLGTIPTTTPPIASSDTSNTASSPTSGLPFVPSSVKTASILNQASNVAFTNYGNSGSSSTQPNIQANALSDQQPFQADPVSQSIFNILGTPDVSYCSQDPQSPEVTVSNSTNPNGASSTPCSISPTMFNSQIIENVVGPIPDASTFYTMANNLNVMPQLNSNSLIAPLYYSQEDLSSLGLTTPEKNSGLTASSQAELAANFIRYVSGSVIPTILPNQYSYSTTYNLATNSGTSQFQMQAVLSNYIASLRVYAAQTSVGMSNLYYILARRVPQQPPNSQNATQLNSQALNEYNMATWRIVNPGASASSLAADGSGSNSSNSSSSSATSNAETAAQSQWIAKINTASPATVQKEIAILLAEINYQLYLDRQLQERMLLTSSVSLLQSTKATQPSSDLSNQSTAASAMISQ